MVVVLAASLGGEDTDCIALAAPCHYFFPGSSGRFAASIRDQMQNEFVPSFNGDAGEGGGPLVVSAVW